MRLSQPIVPFELLALYCKNGKPCTRNPKARLQPVHFSANAETGQEMIPRAMRMRESISTNLYGHFRSGPRPMDPDKRFAAEKAFSSVLASTVREAVGN